MKRIRKNRIASILCATVLAITGTLSASAAQAGNLDRDKLVGEHLGQSYTSIQLSQSDAQIDYVTGNVFFPIGSSIRFPNEDQKVYMLYYNSQDTEDSLLGPGVSSLFLQTVKPYDEAMKELPPEERIMCYTREDGKRTFLFPHKGEQGELVWRDSIQLDYWLRMEDYGYSINGQYVNECRAFGNAGQILHCPIQQRLDYILGLNFLYQDDQLSGMGPCAIRGNDHGIFTPYPVIMTDSQPARIASIEIPEIAPFSARFEYDDAGRLSRYVDESQKLGFVYEGSSSRILKMTDRQGNEVEFKYALIDGLEKVDYVTVKDANGTLIEEKQFWYGNGTTRIRDMDGTVTVKTY